MELMELKDPSEYGLVYGSKNEIRAWHSDMEEPIILATRHESDEYGSHITSLAFNEGTLFDAGYGGVVRETLSGEIIGETGGKASESPLFGIGFLEGRLVALRHEEGFLTRDKDYRVYARLHYVESGEDIASHLGIDWKEELLDYRPHSLDLEITTNGEIYVASQNIVQVCPVKEGKPIIKRLGRYLSDFVLLASDENQVISSHFHNLGSNPDGTEVREVPSGKRLTYWSPDNIIGAKKQKGYGYMKMFAQIGTTLFIGTKEYGADGAGIHEGTIYMMNLTPKMLGSESGSRAALIPLVRRAFEAPRVYGAGNPLIAVMREDLERILMQR